MPEMPDMTVHDDTAALSTQARKGAQYACVSEHGSGAVLVTLQLKEVDGDLATATLAARSAAAALEEVRRAQTSGLATKPKELHGHTGSAVCCRCARGSAASSDLRPSYQAEGAGADGKA
eukprot:s1074_g19.t1